MELERWFLREAFVTELAFVQMLADRSHPMIASFAMRAQRIELVLHRCRMRVHRWLDLDQSVGWNHRGESAIVVESVFVALLIAHVSEEILIMKFR